MATANNQIQSSALGGGNNPTSTPNASNGGGPATPAPIMNGLKDIAGPFGVDKVVTTTGKSGFARAWRFKTRKVNSCLRAKKPTVSMLWEAKLIQLQGESWSRKKFGDLLKHLEKNGKDDWINDVDKIADDWIDTQDELRQWVEENCTKIDVPQEIVDLITNPETYFLDFDSLPAPEIQEALTTPTVKFSPDNTPATSQPPNQIAAPRATDTQRTVQFPPAAISSAPVNANPSDQTAINTNVAASISGTPAIGNKPKTQKRIVGQVSHNPGVMSLLAAKQKADDQRLGSVNQGSNANNTINNNNTPANQINQDDDQGNDADDETNLDAFPGPAAHSTVAPTGYQHLGFQSNRPGNSMMTAYRGNNTTYPSSSESDNESFIKGAAELLNSSRIGTKKVEIEYYDEPSEERINHKAFLNTKEYLPIVSRSTALQPIDPFALENPYSTKFDPPTATEIDRYTKIYNDGPTSWYARVENCIRVQSAKETGTEWKRMDKNTRIQQTFYLISKFDDADVESYLREFEIALPADQWSMSQAAAFYKRLPQPFNTFPDAEYTSTIQKYVLDHRNFELTNTDPQEFLDWTISFNEKVNRVMSPVEVKIKALQLATKTIHPAIARSQGEATMVKYQRLLTELLMAYANPKVVSQHMKNRFRAIGDPQRQLDKWTAIRNLLQSTQSMLENSYRSGAFDRTWDCVDIFKLWNEIALSQVRSLLPSFKLTPDNVSKLIDWVSGQICQIRNESLRTTYSPEIKPRNQYSKFQRYNRNNANNQKIYNTAFEENSDEEEDDLIDPDEVSINFIENLQKKGIDRKQVCGLKCKDRHETKVCPVYLKMPNNEARRKFINDENRCYRCLKKGHNAHRCFVKIKCSEPGCGEPHDVSIHIIKKEKINNMNFDELAEQLYNAEFKDKSASLPHSTIEAGDA